MNKKELCDLLTEIAERDLVEGSELSDHPCFVAVRAIESCFADIDFLKAIATGIVTDKSKAARMILGLRYNPNW